AAVYQRLSRPRETIEAERVKVGGCELNIADSPAKLRLQPRIERDSPDRLPQRAAKRTMPHIVIRFANESLVHGNSLVREFHRAISQASSRCSAWSRSTAWGGTACLNGKLCLGNVIDSESHIV